MKKKFTIEGHDIEFTACSAIAASIGDTVRQPAVFVHHIADEFGNGDGVIFAESIPETEDEAVAFLEEYIDTDNETLETVEIDGHPLSYYVR